MLTGPLRLIVVNRSLQARVGQLVASLSPRKPGFDPRPVHVRFVVGKMT